MKKLNKFTAVICIASILLTACTERKALLDVPVEESNQSLSDADITASTQLESAAVTNSPVRNGDFSRSAQFEFSINGVGPELLSDFGLTFAQIEQKRGSLIESRGSGYAVELYTFKNGIADYSFNDPDPTFNQEALMYGIWNVPIQTFLPGLTLPATIADFEELTGMSLQRSESWVLVFSLGEDTHIEMTGKTMSEAETKLDSQIQIRLWNNFIYKNGKTQEDESLERASYYPNKAVDAFMSRNAEELSDIFMSGESAFEFVKDLQFEEFTLTDSWWSSSFPEGVLRYNIRVKNGKDDIFTKGGTEWEMRATPGGLGRGDIEWFSPVQDADNERNRIKNVNWNQDNLTELEQLALFCYSFTFNMSRATPKIFETRKDFNTIKDDIVSPSDLSMYYAGLYFALGNLASTDGNLTLDSLKKTAKDIVGITNIDIGELMNSHLDYNETSGFIGIPGSCRWGGGLTSTLVSTDKIGDKVEVVLNFYGDTAGLFLAETVKYTIELFGVNNESFRLVSIENLYSCKTHRAIKYGP